MSDPDLYVEYMRLSEVEAAFARRNPRRHDVKTIATSIRLRGYNAPPLLNEKDKRLVYGHGRTKAVRWLYEDDPDRVPKRIKRDEDGEWLLPVFRGVSFRSKDEAEEYLVADNRTAELARWEPEGTAKILERIRKRGKLAGTGYTATQVDRLLAKVRKANPEQDNVPIPVAAEDPGVERGEIWELGKHRVMCGDAMDDGDVDRLLGGQTVDMTLNDPPFAIYGSSTGIGGDIADDRMAVPFFKGMMAQVSRVTREFGHVLIHCDWRSYPVLCAAARPTGLEPKNLLVWDKGDAGMGASYRMCHELVGFWHRMPPKKTMRSNDQRGVRKVEDGNILRHQRVTGDERLHNAAKPIPMEARMVRNSTERGERVLDLFCGSGSVLIACEREQRVCLSMDLEPAEVRKTISRWERETGKQAKRIDTSTAA